MWRLLELFYLMTPWGQSLYPIQIRWLFPTGCWKEAGNLILIPCAFEARHCSYDFNRDALLSGEYPTPMKRNTHQERTFSLSHRV